ncbi:heparan-sulfate 6-O-sulfotransferase 2-like [Mercenaria mercenaria]|uniref:heparan-sulfate 6-O-sulfotransferase 2-like n=1 Tax=Mercenaria mercenaria TaxID=6596 RepID=UPI00234F68A9|nr:heparan-sulfate 6-O-sulfotransferase 2-like [Mercenaria mercenaria]
MVYVRTPYIRFVQKYFFVTWSKRKKMGWKKIISVLIFTCSLGALLFVYLTRSDYISVNENITEVLPHTVIPISKALKAYKNGMLPYNDFEESDIAHSYKVKLDEEDVIVFLHVQKTGGTSFGRHLVKNMDLESPCKCYRKKKRCDCYTKKKTIWLFSRYSTGWMCGLHADWTELTTCVEAAMNKKEKLIRPRRYYYITILRDPVKRYLSEWKHVQRGATWKTARLFCNGRSPTLDEIAPCYNGSDWTGVTLDEFLNCKDNLARNRQTRMLANLTKVNCYNTSAMDSERRDQILLDSAKENLLNMAYFGLTEFQKYTQQLFEVTFKLKFNTEFSQLPVTHSDRTKITDEQKAKILEQNKLDIDLYQYAKDLFLQRVRNMKKSQGDETEVGDYVDNIKDRFDDSVDIEDEDEDDDGGYI